MATAVVYSPDGNGIVVNESKVQDYLDKGYKTQEVYVAEQEEIAKQKYQEWLNDPATLEERFQMLRSARDAKIAETDYLMESDYPISEEKKAKVMAYRTALRDLPAQEGAPWDGGGDLTPWPVKDF